MSIEQLTDAFNIFASVYRLKYPSEADGLSAYMSLVRQTADRNGSWYYYDTNFRRIKQSMNLQWSDIEQELFIMAMTKSPQPFRAGREVESDKRSFNKTSKSKRNYKSCDKYNKRTHCGGCNFPHICAFCGRTNHPQFKCRSKNKDHQPDDQSNSIKVHQQLNRQNPQNLDKPILPIQANELPTPVQWSKLQQWLKGYDKAESDYIISGFKHGFRLGFTGPRTTQNSPNLPSALSNSEIVNEKIKSELAAGRVAGPFDVKPFNNLKI